MRQPVYVRVRSAGSQALRRRQEQDKIRLNQARTNRLRLALEFVTLLMLGWSAVYAATLAGRY